MYVLQVNIYIYTHIHRTLKAPNPKADKLKG